MPIAEQPRIPDIIARLRPPEADTAPVGGLSASIERTRATVKVQDGCNLRCAFCAVTLARGNLRSRPIAEIMPELRALADAGMREIVLTGIRLDAYGLDSRRRDWPISSTRRGNSPSRAGGLSSLEPIGINAHLARRLAAHPGVCHHFHVCLQSGDDGVLRAMRRGYTADRYRRLIGLLRDAMPDATFTTDLIVGFPGESDEAFARTCALAEEIGFIKIHIFPFSPRPGTVAAALGERVPETVKEARGQHSPRWNAASSRITRAACWARRSPCWSSAPAVARWLDAALSARSRALPRRLRGHHPARAHHRRGR